MAIIRVAVCSVCNKQQPENNYGDGWEGWGALKGIALDGDSDVMLCPEHLANIADTVDALKINLQAEDDGVHNT